MSIQKPIATGSEHDERPNAIWEIMVEAEFDPALAPQQILEQQRALWDRLMAAVETAASELDACVEVAELSGRGAETPLFPVVVGQARFTANLDVVELVEGICHSQTDLAHGLAYDAVGRAYEIDIDIRYRRRPREDGMRYATMPDPAAVADVLRRRDTFALTHGLNRARPLRPN